MQFVQQILKLSALCHLWFFICFLFVSRFQTTKQRHKVHESKTFKISVNVQSFCIFNRSKRGHKSAINFAFQSVVIIPQKLTISKERGKFFTHRQLTNCNFIDSSSLFESSVAQKHSNVFICCVGSRIRNRIAKRR